MQVHRIYIKNVKISQEAFIYYPSLKQILILILILILAIIVRVQPFQS